MVTQSAQAGEAVAPAAYELSARSLLPLSKTHKEAHRFNRERFRVREGSLCDPEEQVGVPREALTQEHGESEKQKGDFHCGRSGGHTWLRD